MIDNFIMSVWFLPCYILSMFIILYIPTWYMMVKRKGAFPLWFVNTFMLVIAAWSTAIFFSLLIPAITDTSAWTSKPSHIVKKTVYVDTISNQYILDDGTRIVRKK